MEAIKDKTAILITDHETLVQNLQNSILIASKMTECLDNIRLDDDKTQTSFDSQQFYNSTTEMLEKFTELFQKFNSEIYKSYRTLSVTGNGFNMKNFTHPACDVHEYKENYLGECVISNVENVSDQHCYIIDIERPKIVLTEYLGANYTSLPEPGEVFAIDLQSDGLFRAVRNNFIFGEPKTMALCLIDTGEVIDIPFNYDKMYALPPEIRSIESRGILCKVLGIYGRDGHEMELNLDTYLKELLYETVYFQIGRIENNILWIKIFLEKTGLDEVSPINSARLDVSSSLNPFASEFIYSGTVKTEFTAENGLTNGYFDEFQAVDDPTTPLVHIDTNNENSKRFTNMNIQYQQNYNLFPRMDSDDSSTDSIPVSLKLASTEEKLSNGYTKLSLSGDDDSNFGSSPENVQPISSNIENLSSNILNNEREQNSYPNMKPRNDECPITNLTKPLTNVNDLTPEQLEILYEEPLNTSNAVKAVMGYVPQDEKRICKFYDPRTKACFKGARCRFEHVAILKDGWTRDRSLVKIAIRAEQILPNIDQIVTLFPTYIVNVEEFYAHIPELRERSTLSLLKLQEQLNKKEKRAKYRRYKRLPGEFELVFVLYKENICRAKIVEVTESKVKVFLVDYGPSVFTKLDNMYEWEDHWDYIPFQVYQCRLDKIKKVQDTNAEAIKELQSRILNKPISAKILFTSDELLVQLLDNDGFDISEELCALGLAQFCERQFANTVGLLPG